MRQRIIFIDDEPNIISALKRVLIPALSETADIYFTSDMQKALEWVREIEFDVIVSDYLMPDMSGLEFIKISKTLQPDAILLMLSASTEFEVMRTAVNELNIYKYLIKPWVSDELCRDIAMALNKASDDRYQRELAGVGLMQFRPASPD
jgi:two-component system, probable response regulator PhcQ